MPALAAGPGTPQRPTRPVPAACSRSRCRSARCAWGSWTSTRTGSVPLPAAAVGSALGFADLAMDMLVDGQAAAPAGQVEPDVNEVLAPRLEVYQAQGMVMVDLGVSLTEAMALLRAHAFTLGRPLGDVARDVVAGRLRLEP